MFHRPMALAGLVLLAAVGQGPAQPGKGDASATIDQVKLGKLTHGPAVSEAGLKGQVVLIEIWGIN
jgi:hypothetical protein